MRELVVALLLVTVGLAGCLGNEAADSTNQPGIRDGAVVWHEDALPFGPGHDHEDPSQHASLTTPNFNVTGHTPLNSSFYGAPAGAYFCGDAQPVDGDRRLAAVESRSQVGFALADITDPNNPQWLGEMVMNTTRIYDLAVAPDGEHVFLVTSGLRDAYADEALPDPPAPGQDPEPVPGMTWRSPCMEEPAPVTWSRNALETTHEQVPRPMSLILVDITDPTNPTIQDQHPMAGSGHSVYSTRIDDTDWAMVTTTRLPGPVGTPGLDENGVSTYEFYQLTEGPNGAMLEPVSVWKRTPEDPTQAAPTEPTDNAYLGPRGHDGWLAKHPKTGDLTAYLAGGERFSMLDMSTPTQPALLGQWTVQGPATPAEEGTLHSVWPLPELWNGTHYTLVGPEHAGHPEGAPSGIIWVLDTTDPTQPEPVAAWTLPAEVNWNGTYMFSNHYLTVVDETLFVSMYHGGVWAIDLSPLRDGQHTPTGNLSIELLDSEGVWLPTTDLEQEMADPARWAPTSEEVLSMPDGSLVTFTNTGLFTATYDAGNPMPAPEPWPLEDAIELDS